MYKNSSAKHYQDNKARERYQNASNKEELKNYNMVVNDTKMYQKMKNKNWLSIEKILRKTALQ